MTVRTRGEAGSWLQLARVRIEGAGVGPDGKFYEVEESRAYRDRLVLKLEGVDEANTAAGLRGASVLVARAEAPQLPEGRHYVEELEGLLVVDASGDEIGLVVGVVASGDADVLRVRPPGEEETEELLIPMAPDFVRSIDPEAGRIEAEVPEELRELNRRRPG